MPIREDQLNGRIATIIRECTPRSGWTITEETQGALASSARRPDILITRPEPEPPIVLENEYSAARIARDCLNKLGQTLATERGGQTVSTVIGILSPAELHNAANGDEAESLLRIGVPLQYAAYTGTPADYRRFPVRGFITGNVRNLVEFIRPAAEPADLIRQASETLADGAAIAAYAILNSPSDRGTGVRIAEKLRQPWPTGDSSDPKQAAADLEARRQTATMAATIIINALAYQQNLEGYAGIKGLGEMRPQTVGGRLTKDDVILEFDHILNVNFWPIFHVARELLLGIPSLIALYMLDGLAQTAQGISEAIRHNDIAGTVFQRLIADRQTLKTYYTTPEAAVLLTHLAIPEDLDWFDPNTFRNFRIADYACGSGGIMLAAYQRIRELHRLHGGGPDAHHAHMMQECLTACDIMPAGVHLTASLLSSVAPTVTYAGTRCIQFPFGGQRKVDRGQLVRDQDRNPVKETDGKGNPIVHLGSIGLLDLNATRFQAVLPPDEQTALGARGSGRNIDVPMVPASQDLVAMNPPFTTPTKHAPLASTDHVDPRNPAFAAFGTTDAEQEAMKALERKLGANTISDGNAGLGTTFTAIAHNMVKPGGRIALILPTAAMTGGSYDADKRQGRGQAYSWQRLRNLLCDNYDQIVVMSIAQPRDKDSAFSADADFADCMVIARRLPAGAHPGTEAHFISLKAVPATKLEAQETARVIRAAIRETDRPGSHRDITIGDEVVGAVSLDTIRRNRRWTNIRIANPGLVTRLRQLEQSILRLPQSAADIAIPVSRIGAIGNVGPLHRDIAERGRGPFTKVDGCRSDHEYPMLWNHYPIRREAREGKDPQKSMLTRPDSHGVASDDRDTAAVAMWQHATHLHINIRFRFNANSTAAAYTPQRSLGGAMWPTVKLAAPELEKALCVWLNSTLGMAIYWLESDRGQDGRGGTTVTHIPDIPVLDVTQLDAAQLAAAVQIFDDLKERVMKPANEAWHDLVRQELDQRLLMEVLNLDNDAVERLGILRRQWCREPTVTAAKQTGPPD